MATIFNLYDQFRLARFNSDGAIDLEAESLHAVLVSAAYSLDQQAHVNWSDVVNAQAADPEIAHGGNYVSGGAVLSSVAVTLDAGGTVVFDTADPTTWAQTAGGFSNADRLIVLHESGEAKLDWKVLGYSASFGPKGNADGDFSITINAAGLFTSTR